MSGCVNIAFNGSLRKDFYVNQKRIEGFYCSEGANTLVSCVQLFYSAIIHSYYNTNAY